jgi:hypothetical protein
MGSAGMAVGMTLSLEGNRARAAVEGEMEHFFEISSDEIYKVCSIYECACFCVCSRLFRFMICVFSSAFSPRWITRCLPL